jgi:hypothetical protein
VAKQDDAGAKKWTLGTPAWNRRTRHFYKKVGFVEVGKDGHDGILFEKTFVQVLADIKASKMGVI